MEVSKSGRLFRETNRRTHGPAVSQPAALPVVQLTRQIWQVSSVRRRQGETDSQKNREAVKLVDLLGCDLCDERQRSEA